MRARILRKDPIVEEAVLIEVCGVTIEVFVAASDEALQEGAYYFVELMLIESESDVPQAVPGAPPGLVAGQEGAYVVTGDVENDRLTVGQLEFELERVGMMPPAGRTTVSVDRISAYFGERVR